jgi:hypothetical protein
MLPLAISRALSPERKRHPPSRFTQAIELQHLRGGARRGSGGGIDEVGTELRDERLRVVGGSGGRRQRHTTELAKEVGHSFKLLRWRSLFPLLFLLPAVADLEAERAGMLAIEGLGHGIAPRLALGKVHQHASPRHGLEHEPIAAAHDERRGNAGCQAGPVEDPIHDCTLVLRDIFLSQIPRAGNRGKAENLYENLLFPRAHRRTTLRSCNR